MDAEFLAHVAALRPKLEALLAMVAVSPAELPKAMPKAGVYLLSDHGKHLYVGRSNNIRARIARHCRPGATHRTAAFAFRLARHETGRLEATYKTGEGSRAALVQEPLFGTAFSGAKARIRNMELRYVEEADPVRQTLLEVYVALAVKAKHNDFDNH
jgi:predicted GIY-YIG superfamily endonuclease